MADRLNPDQPLAPGQRITSENGRAFLIMQEDGNLVLYEATDSGQRPLWASDTYGRNGASAIMQTDGNLVVYAPDHTPLWSSSSWNHPGAFLVMQDDGNAVVYDPAGLALWDSKTMLGVLHASSKWDHPNGFHMEGDAYLTAQGQLRADITTWSTSWGLGFGGGGMIVVIDSGENIIYRWLALDSAGVDGKAVWWKRSRRTDHPETQIEPALAARAERIELWLSHMPRDRWNDIINDVRQRVSDVKQLYTDIAGSIS